MSLAESPLRLILALLLAFTGLLATLGVAVDQWVQRGDPWYAVILAAALALLGLGLWPLWRFLRGPAPEPPQVAFEPAALTANILRHWSREAIVRFARHLLGAEEEVREPVMVLTAHGWIEASALRQGELWRVRLGKRTYHLRPEKKALSADDGTLYTESWEPIGSLLRAFCGEVSAAENLRRLQDAYPQIVAAQEPWPVPAAGGRAAIAVTTTPTAALADTLRALRQNNMHATAAELLSQAEAEPHRTLELCAQFVRLLPGRRPATPENDPAP